MHPFLRRLTHLPSPVRPIVSSSSSFSTFPAPTASAATTATTTNTTNYVGTLLPFDEEPPVNAQKVDTSSLISEQTSINQTMNDLPDLQPASSLTPPDTEISTLPNGVRVVSQETFRQCTTVSALVQVGSRYETNDTTGCTHLIEQMAFKSTTKRSHSEVIGALESIGGVPQAVASREEIVYSVDVLREHSHKAMEILGEVVCSPQILPEELEESRQVIGFLLENSVDQFSGNIQGNVMEELTSVAFGGGSRDEEASDSEEAAKTASPPPLGRPLFHDPLRTGSDGMPAPNIDVVRQFHGDHFCGENVIVSAAGLDHQEAVQLAKQHFGHLPQAPKDPNVTVLREQALVPNDYVGGCRLVDIPNLDYVHVGLGFETGGW
jgi:processing peptidase subunit alpha